MTSPATAPPPAPPAGSDATIRRWLGLDDIDEMAAANGRLRARIRLLEPIDPVTMRHRYTHLVNSDPATDCLVLERDGATRGYARVEWHDLVEGSRVYDTTLVVEPSCWGLGLSEALLAWCERRAAELAREHATDRPSHLQGYAFGGDDAATAAFEGAGYTAVRWDAEMLRPDLLDLPAVELPAGYELRAPEMDELPAVHAMMIEGFAEHWGEAEASDWELAEWIEDPRFRRDLVVVAWHGSAPAACVTNLLEPAPDGTVRGLLDGVVTHPDHRRRGLARACIARSLDLLRAGGASSAYLGVDTDNHNRALALYESCGFRAVSRSTTYRKALRGPRGTAPMAAIPGLVFRYATPADWEGIAEVLNAARRADALDEVQTGETMAGEHPDSETFRLQRDVLVAALDGRVVGYVMGNVVARGGLLVGESFGDVHPDVRGRGVGTGLLRDTRTRLARALADDPRPGPRELRSYAMEQERAARRLLEAEGYVPVRFGFEMRRTLTGALPGIPLPPGLELRPVSTESHRAIFAADNEAFRDHWGYREANEGDFQVRFHGPDADTSLWQVAWDGDQVAGVVIPAIFASENEALGIRRAWLDHVSVRRPWRGRGLAKALCAASFRVLRERGMDEAWLGVDAKNPTGALVLYEHLGFTVARRWYAYGRPVDGPAPEGWESGSG